MGSRGEPARALTPAAERGRPRGTGQRLGPRLSPPPARCRHPKPEPERPPRQAPRGARLWGKGAVRGLRGPLGGFPKRARSPGICGRSLGWQGPWGTLCRTWSPGWALPPLLCSAPGWALPPLLARHPKGLCSEARAHRRSFTKAQQGILGPQDAEVAQVSLRASAPRRHSSRRASGDKLRRGLPAGFGPACQRGL